MTKNDFIKFIDEMLLIDRSNMKNKNLFAQYYVNMVTALEHYQPELYNECKKLKTFYDCNKIEVKQIRKIILSK